MLPEVYKLQSNNPRNKFKAKIHKDDGLLGTKFTLDKTISEFIRASEKLNLEYVTSFAKFGNVLLGRYQTDWKQVLHEHFPEPVDPEVAKPAQDCALAENFLHAINLFLICTLNKKKPRDSQYNNLASGGDHGIHKELLTSPLDHLHHFKEMLRITKLILKGIFLNPMPLFRYSGSTCLFIARIARSMSAAGTSSAMRRYRFLPSTLRVFFLLVSAMAQSKGSTRSSFVWLPITSFAMSLKSATERSSRGSRRAKSITLAAGGMTSKVAGLLATTGLLAMAIVAALKLVAPATRALAGITRPPLRTVSLTGRAICMAPTASIPMTSAARTQKIKHTQTTTTTT